MKYTIFLSSLVAFANAAPNFADWHGPVPGDSRSPCPALNALANHGILPRDGRNLTVPVLVKAMQEGLNVSTEVATTLATISLTVSPDPTSNSIDLEDLDKHNAVEHDGSLSRKDFDLGGASQDFCPEVFAETLSYYNGASEVGIAEVAAARWGRLQSSKANNPNFVYGEAQQFPSYFESSVYYQMFKDPKTSKASVKLIRIFFEEERLPWAEGWTPANHIDGFSIAQVVLQLAQHTPEKADSMTMF